MEILTYLKSNDFAILVLCTISIAESVYLWKLMKRIEKLEKAHKKIKMR